MAEETKQNPEEDRPVFEWKAPEFAEYKRNPGWFIIIVLAALLLIAFFVWNKSWTAAGVVFAAALALFTSTRVNAKKVDCKMFRDGVVIGDKAYRFSDLKSFWIIYGTHPSVRFAKPGRFSALINMPISDEDPEQIKLFLSKYLPHDQDRGEEMTDTLGRWLRF